MDLCVIRQGSQVWLDNSLHFLPGRADRYTWAELGSSDPLTSFNLVCSPILLLFHLKEHKSTSTTRP